MTVIVKVDLDTDGKPHPAFCSCCGNFQKYVVWVLASEGQIVICADCLTAIAMAHIGLLTFQLDSQA